MAMKWVASGLLLVLGCAPNTVSSPGRAPDQPVAQLESTWSRHALPAEGITVHATLWDASLVSAATEGQRRGRAPQAWADRYLRRTAFTVVIELEDRRPVVDPAPLLAPSGWSFALSLNKGDDAPRTDVVAPSAVDLLLVDRFPTTSGDHHHRVAMAVFFEGDLQEAAQRGERVALVVKPRLPEPERGRSMIGKRWARAGTTLTWRLSAREDPRSGPGDH